MGEIKDENTVMKDRVRKLKIIEKSMTTVSATKLHTTHAYKQTTTTKAKNKVHPYVMPYIVYNRGCRCQVVL